MSNTRIVDADTLEFPEGNGELNPTHGLVLFCLMFVYFSSRILLQCWTTFNVFVLILPYDATLLLPLGLVYFYLSNKHIINKYIELKKI